MADTYKILVGDDYRIAVDIETRQFRREGEAGQCCYRQARLCGTASQNEIQQISITGSPPFGSFPITYAGQTTTPIPFNATAAQVDSALEALSNIPAGGVTCTGGPLPGTPIVVEFTGGLANTNVVQMTAGSGLPFGTTAVITTIQEGGFGMAGPYVDMWKPIAEVPNGDEVFLHFGECYIYDGDPSVCPGTVIEGGDPMADCTTCQAEPPCDELDPCLVTVGLSDVDEGCYPSPCWVKDLLVTLDRIQWFGCDTPPTLDCSPTFTANHGYRYYTIDANPEGTFCVPLTRATSSESILTSVAYSLQVGVIGTITKYHRLFNDHGEATVGCGEPYQVCDLYMSINVVLDLVANTMEISVTVFAVDCPGSMIFYSSGPIDTALFCDSATPTEQFESDLEAAGVMCPVGELEAATITPCCGEE